jgi:hypothetical protein
VKDIPLLVRGYAAVKPDLRHLADDDLALRLSRGSVALAEELSLDREQNAWMELYSRMLAR